MRILLAAALVAAPAAAAAFDLQGHRGARGLAPENTLAGFARALEVGVVTLELDLAMTQDGVLVVSHEPVLNPDLTRGPDGAWLAGPGPVIHRTPLETVQAYDVGRLKPGTRYASRYPQQRPADGERIPRLADVFALAAKAGDDVRFNIEIKTDPRKPDLAPAPEPFAEAVAQALREAGLTERATVQSFDWRGLVHLRRIAPEIDTACLTAQQSWLDNVEAGRPGASPWLAGLDADEHGSPAALAKAAGCAIWSPYYRELSPERLAEAKSLGLAVVPWTVNEPADMARSIAMGVDGLITDRPDLAREEMAKAGLTPPAPRPVSR